MIDRFYYDGSFTSVEVILTDKEYRHAKVMRIQKGDKISLVNGKGEIAFAEALEITDRSLIAKIINVKNEERPPYIRALSLAMMKQSNLELVIEKATELGIDQFFLFFGNRSEKTDLKEKQLERLSSILISAMKQCGRLYLPTIKLFSTIQDFPSFSGKLYFGDLDNKTSSHISKDESSCIFIGPEKGFDKRELSYLRDKLQAKGITLGKYQLRAETAAIAAAALQACIK